jgi:three-Cys-motif partner protein
VGKHKHSFGGRWTLLKLDLVAKYLQLYVTALKNQPFNLIYVDAFAGTGYLDSLDPEAQRLLDIPELRSSLRGSAQNALTVEPSFHRYVFVDKDRKHCAELGRMVSERFAALEKRVKVACREANDYLGEFCRWMGDLDRAVLFLDPYGLQVKWKTVEAIAASQKIDMWYLFPLGIAVNRLLRRDAQIREAERRILDRLLGETDSYRRFYQPVEELNLFGETQTALEKRSMTMIAEYFHGRLASVFAAVAKDYRFLYNSRNNPLFVLYFAVANPSPAAQKPALKFARYVLKD